MVVGKDTQTRQMQLKAKMVKAIHGRHYIKGSLSSTKAKTLRKEEKRKKKRKLETTKENKEIEWQACTNRLIRSLHLRARPSTKDKRFFWAQAIQVRFSQSDYFLWQDFPWEIIHVEENGSLLGLGPTIWHSKLIFLFLFFKLMSYLLISTIFFTRLFLSL